MYTKTLSIYNNEIQKGVKLCAASNVLNSYLILKLTIWKLTIYPYILATLIKVQVNRIEMK